MGYHRRQWRGPAHDPDWTIILYNGNMAENILRGIGGPDKSC
jgi:hypothetical protein